MARVVPVLADCSERGAHAELMEKYGVRGYPTIIYTDPDGKQIGELDDRSSSGVAKEIEGLLKKWPGKPSIWQPSMKVAVEAAKKAKKPVAVFVAKTGTDLLKLTQKLTKDLGDRKSKAFWVLVIEDKDPEIRILNPKAEDPAAEPVETIVLVEDQKAADFQKALDEALKKVKF